MNAAAGANFRPRLVTLGVAVLLLNFVTNLTVNTRDADWSDFQTWLKFSPALLLWLVVLWCVFKGMNWARWVVCGMILCGCVLGWVLVARGFSSASGATVVHMSLRMSLYAPGIVALFAPASNRWFREQVKAGKARGRSMRTNPGQ